MGVQIHGHRGGAGKKYSDNTLPAIEYGLQHKADGIEVDLRMTKDHTLVLQHDMKINHKHAIQDLSLEQLHRYDNSIPTLPEFITVMKQPENEHVILNLEMKDYDGMNCQQYLSLLIDEIEKSELPPPRIFLQSFDAELMRMAKQLRTNWKWKIGFTASVKNASTPNIKNQGMDVFSCEYKFINEALLQDMHKLGLQVYAWTVNREEDIKAMINLGVDAIITDYPETAVRVRKELIDAS